jgi:hypothetical protein
MKIVGTEGLTSAQVQEELQRGARFVIYQYCISLIAVTFKRPSNIYFIRAGHGPVTRGLGFSAATLLLGWWGIPWGPIYTIQALWVNFSGGRDVTSEVVASASASQPIPQARRA